MTDDYAPSSGPRQAPSDSGFVQGFVVEWDARAGTNKVRIRGTVFDNLLSGLGSEGGLVRPDDTVLCGRLGNTYAVLARCDFPGQDQRSLGVVSAETVTLNNPVTNGFEARNAPFVNAYIGSSGRAMVTLSMEISITNNVQRLGVAVSGPTSIVAVAWRALTVGGTSSMEVQASRVLMFGPENGTTLNEGMTRFQVMAQTANHLASLPLVGEVQITVQPF